MSEIEVQKEVLGDKSKSKLYVEHLSVGMLLLNEESPIYFCAAVKFTFSMISRRNSDEIPCQLHAYRDGSTASSGMAKVWGHAVSNRISTHPQRPARALSRISVNFCRAENFTFSQISRRNNRGDSLPTVSLERWVYLLAGMPNVCGRGVSSVTGKNFSNTSTMHTTSDRV